MSLALYRRYRPESFAEVIGQDHVSGPLQQALRNGRIHHAFLFSGPRGCGKTTSARILARALNCEQGPTPEPCGVCDSCVALARNGPGSLDVIEIDAASHGGVDDARDLRERAFFAPATSRFKVYIVDEAHMVTTQGFNALLKLVEEPPEHVKFIFATTEPEKVIGTIRSRTHHYPFRLVPPGTLTAYLADLCAQEGIEVDPAVLPLVVLAGGGSVRDSLSVLDQLLAGAGQQGVTYAEAIALLGYTDASLLDGVVDAFAASDGAAVFELVDRVVEAGHDPRRFVADLLDRLRDLILVDAVPDAIEKGLVVGPPEVLTSLPAQSARFGRAELVRAADLVNAGLTELRGATAPRLQLELICARVLLPAASTDEIGLHARVDRLERRLSIAAAPSEQPAPTEPRPDAEQPTRTESRSQTPDVPAPAPPPVAPAAAPPPPPTARASLAIDAVEVRRLWPSVLDQVKARRRVTWMLLFEKVTVSGVGPDGIVLAFPDTGSLANFSKGQHDAVLAGALRDALGVDLPVQAVLDPSRPATPGGFRAEASRPADHAAGESRPAAQERTAAGSSKEVDDGGGAADDHADAGAPPSAPSRGTDEMELPTVEPTDRPGRSTADAYRRAGATRRGAAAAGAEIATGPRSGPIHRDQAATPVDEPDPDADPDAEDEQLSAAELVARELGAVVVERVVD